MTSVPGGTLTGNLILSNNAELWGQISPFQSATGSQAGAPSARSWKLNGNVTAVPITNGWWARYVNVSGSAKTITPATGNCISTKLGASKASVSVANNKSATVQGDGTNLIVDGDVT